MMNNLFLIFYKEEVSPCNFSNLNFYFNFFLTSISSFSYDLNAGLVTKASV